MVCALLSEEMTRVPEISLGRLRKQEVETSGRKAFEVEQTVKPPGKILLNK